MSHPRSPSKCVRRSLAVLLAAQRVFKERGMRAD